MSAAVLAFRLARREYCIELARVSGLADCGRLRAVPLSPPAVLGLGEWRGRLLTVLDLPRLLDDGAGEGPATLVRLAAPHESTALFVPGPVRLARRPVASARSVDPLALIRAVETEVTAGQAPRAG